MAWVNSNILYYTNVVLPVELSELILDCAHKRCEIDAVVAAENVIVLADCSHIDQSIFFGHIAQAAALGCQLTRLDVVLNLADITRIKRIMPSLKHTHVSLPLWDYRKYKLIAKRKYDRDNKKKVLSGKQVVNKISARNEMLRYCREMKESNRRLQEQVDNLSEQLRLCLEKQERLK